MLVVFQRMSIASQAVNEGCIPNQKLQVEDVALLAPSGAVKSASPSDIDIILGVELDSLFCDSVMAFLTGKFDNNAQVHIYTQECTEWIFILIFI